MSVTGRVKFFNETKGYKTQPVTNNPINTNVACDPVNTPIVFEPPSALVGATPQVWIAASGGAAGAADPNWGGCNIFLSADGSSYTQIGAIVGAAVMGSLTASLALFTGTNPDTADTLAVNLAESGGTLSSVSSLEAQLAATLCIVDSELVSYATATLTGSNQYALTGLYRGMFGTAIASHASGAPFGFLNTNAIFKYNLPPQYVGKTLSLKFQSFNVFGGGLQNLSSCAVYTYTPTGNAETHPVALAWQTGAPMDMGSVTAAPTVTDDFSSVTKPDALDADLGAA